ncbi:MAG: response regulator transcription factor [Saprospiraceae bacterium]|nr:response regulator transcription factor [Saprospiraceae bacterium]
MNNRSGFELGDIPGKYLSRFAIQITSREQQILLLIASDLTSREVAQQLFISPETVKSHRSSLIRKLGVKTTAGLIVRGFELGLLKCA